MTTLFNWNTTSGCGRILTDFPAAVVKQLFAGP